MNPKVLMLLGSIVLSFTSLSQQKEKPVLIIGNQSFSLQEFEYIYNKNNSVSQEPITKDAYLNLFVNYKLKVRAAQEAGMDTAASFVSELNYYRNELSKPLLSDRKTEELIVQEAYDRMRYEVDVSHLLIMVKPDASTQDTITAWNKVKKAYDELLKGEDFGQVALRYSEDPSVTRNSGRLGYFSAFQMVYPFENGAYQTPIGEISPIVRSPYGYHLIKVHDKRPATGSIHVAHVMTMLPQNASADQINSAKLAIDTIYQRIVAGDDFSSMAAQYSDDQQSAMAGGELPWFTRGRMISSFSDVAFSLKGNNDVSEPFRTPYGWHIVKRLDYKPIGSLEEERDNIMQQLSNDERSHAGVTSLVASLKKSYHFHIDSVLLKNLLQIFDAEPNDSLLQAKARALSGTLFSFHGGDKGITAFVNALDDANLLKAGESSHRILELLSHTEEQTILDYEKSVLEKKYPDFRFLMQEYHDGLLVFEISQRMIWEKAAADSTALRRFYEANIHRYSDPESFHGVVCVFQDSRSADKFKATLKRNVSLSEEELKRIAGKKATVYRGDFLYGDNKELDGVLWPKNGLANPLVVTDGRFEFRNVNELDAIRGSVISDFQNYLESEWLKALHDKFQPKIFRKAIN